MELSPVVAEYLLQLYVLAREGKRIVPARLAERSGVSPPAVHQALRRMARDGLVSIDDEYGIRFTAEGRRTAETFMRRHFLLERMLVDILGFDWAEADKEAEQLALACSGELEDFLYERLGRPTTCPHGNPFPGSPDEDRLVRAAALTEAKAGQEVTILRVVEDAEEDMELMYFLRDHGLLPGARVTIVSTNGPSGEIELQAEEGPVIRMSPRHAGQLRVA
jgi:DtxR family Mn-dependent transcriptional regulator